MSIRLLLLVVVLSFLTTCPTAAATRTWTGAVNADWYESGNWSPAGVPDPADTLDVMAPNQLAITPPFTLTGQLNWNGGYLYGALTVHATGVMNVGDCGVFGLLTNHGTINVPGGLTIYLSIYLRQRLCRGFQIVALLHSKMRPLAQAVCSNHENHFSSL